MPVDAPACPACGVQVAPRDPERDAAWGPPVQPLTAEDPFAIPPPGSDERSLPPPPPTPSRRATWLLLLALVGCYLNAAGDAWRQGLTKGQLLGSGLLTPAALLDPLHDGWRLVHGSLIHQNPLVLMVTCFLVLRLAGEVERRVGVGSMLFLFVAGGALLNAVRLETESETSRVLLAGGWPAGCLLGGVALTSALRVKAGLWGVLLTLGIDLTILAMVASAPGVGLNGMLLTAGAGLVLGGVLGSFLPLRRPSVEQAALPGWMLGVVAFCLVGGAEAMRPQATRAPGGPGAGPGSGDGRPPAPPAELHQRASPGLGLDLELPESWEAQAEPGRADCEACGESAGPATADESRVDCPGCGARVKVNPLRRVRFVESGLWTFQPRHLDVWSWPKGPFDAPDTLAGRRLAEVAQGEIPFREPVLLEDRAFRGSMGLGHQVVLRVRLDDQGDQPFVFRLYVFVGAARTAYVSALTREPDDLEQRSQNQALFDAIARSVRERE